MNLLCKMRHFILQFTDPIFEPTEKIARNWTEPGFSAIVSLEAVMICSS